MSNAAIAVAGLTSDFASRLDELLSTLKAKGVTMEPYFGLRDPVTQARLWRQSRDAGEISAARAMLISHGAPFLADCLDRAGRTRGPWATNALPGLSWHQYGEACDCVWVRDGVDEWSVDVDGAANGYRVYAATATAHGLTPLGPSIGDWGHVQADPHGSPLVAYGYPKIDSIMQAKFGHAAPVTP